MGLAVPVGCVMRILGWVCMTCLFEYCVVGVAVLRLWVVGGFDLVVVGVPGRLCFAWVGML